METLKAIIEVSRDGMVAIHARSTEHNCMFLGCGGSEEEAKEDFYKLAGVSVLAGLVFGGLYYASSYVVPGFYNTTESIRSLAASLMRICAIAMPFDAFANAAYFTLRSGGKAFVTFLFDSGFSWVINVPTAFILSRFTGMPLLVLYAVCQGELLLKDALGLIYVKKGIWLKNITKETDG